MDWTSVGKFFEANWSTLMSAPLIFLICIAIGIAGGYLLGKWYFRRTIDILKGRLEAKDDQLDEYRERLKLMHPNETGSKYSRMTNDELKRRVLDMVDKIRTFHAETQQKSQRLILAERAYMMKVESAEEFEEIRNKYSNQIMSESLETSEKYNRRFKVDAILLRDEMLSRLPETAKNKRAYFVYEHPTNPIGMGMVADDLERLAKSLEVKKGR